MPGTRAPCPSLSHFIQQISRISLLPCFWSSVTFSTKEPLPPKKIQITAAQSLNKSMLEIISSPFLTTPDVHSSNGLVVNAGRWQNLQGLGRSYFQFALYISFALVW